MRWPHAVLVSLAVVLALGLIGLQVWLTGQQQAAQRAAIQAQEAAVARQKADLEAWQARARTQPGQPLPPPPVQPLPPVYQPPVIFPWFLWTFPLLMAPAAYLAAEQQRRARKVREQEEEDRTPYTAEDLMDNWEFKIVRCVLPLFDDPAFLQGVLQEEERAGWQLLEKFDGTRVRLKRVAGRPPAADLPAGYDPYRTTVGPKGQVKVHVLLWFFCGICLALAAVFVAAHLAQPISAPTFWSLLASAAGGAVVLGLLAVRQTRRYRRATRPAPA